MENLKLNPVVEFILSTAKSDRASIIKGLTRGGQTSVDFLGAFASMDVAQRIALKGRMMLVHIANLVTSDSTDVNAYTVKSYGRACALVALAPIGERVRFVDVHYLCGATAKGIESAPINGVSRARLMRYMPRAGAVGTITTQVSSALGCNGLFGALNCVEGDLHGFTVTSKGAPLLIAYAQALDKITDGRLSLVPGFGGDE